MNQTAGSERQRVGVALYSGLFLITLATLMYEVLLTRIYSVITWYHFAFVAVSIALFGLTGGGLFVHLVPERFPASDVHAQLRRYSLQFAVSIVFSLLIQLLIPFGDGWSFIQIVSYLVTSVPFFFSGVCVALALTRFSHQVGRLYAADLAGAALGSVSLIWVLRIVDGVTAGLVVGVIAGIAALCFAFAAGSGNRRLLPSLLALSMLVAIAGANAFTAANGSPLLRLVWVKGQQDPLHTAEFWNP